MQKIITEEGPLLDEKGRLKESGYAKYLVKKYERSKIGASHLRIKEWDYYLVYDQNYALCLTIADNSYMGDYSVSWIDFHKEEETTKSIMTVLPNGKTGLPESSIVGDVSFENDKISISFKHDGDQRILDCTFPNFQDWKELKAHVILEDIPRDSIVVMTPFKEDKKAFYYNQKINCMKAHGTVTLGDFSYMFEEDTYACLDWGRGVWTYENTWYWSSASGVIDGHRFGFNLGYGFGDTTTHSENMLFYDGVGHKLDRIFISIPLDEDDHEDWLHPWTFTSNDGRFGAKFVPILNRSALVDAYILKTDQNQVFGRFYGKAILDDDTVIDLDGILGFAEKVFNRW